MRSPARAERQEGGWATRRRGLLALVRPFLSLCPLGRGRPQAASAAGEVDSVTFACDGSNEACRGGVLEWSCSAHCNARSASGARACLMNLRSSGLNGTLPTAIADLRCVGLLANMYANTRPDSLMPVT